MKPKRTISVIMTVRNDPDGCAVTLNSLAQQTRKPDEIVVVDGGSTDDTVSRLRARTKIFPQLKIIESNAVNIAQGRNLAAQNATGEILACTDAGCRCHPDWIEQLARPFEQQDELEFVAGFYHIDPATLLEEVVGLATMRGQLDPVDPETFNPSARSMACTKALWRRVGGWPEWIRFSEDTLFDHKVRKTNAKWHFARQAVVSWRPRNSLRAIARQFYNYGTGRGHTRINAAAFKYNLRNLALLAACLVAACAFPLALIPAAALFAYFYLWAFQDTARRIMRRTGKIAACPLAYVVIWTVLFAHLAGFLVGSFQRKRGKNDYEKQLQAYLAVS